MLGLYSMLFLMLMLVAEVLCIISSLSPWIWGIPLIGIYIFGLMSIVRRINRVIAAEQIIGDPCSLPNIARELIKVSVVVIAFSALAGFYVHALWQNYMWKMEVLTLADYEGATRARHDFQAGKLRLFVLGGERDDDKFSGTNEGPFEVWYPQYFPEFYPSRYSQQQMIIDYNERMRELQKDASRSSQGSFRGKNDIPPQFAFITTNTTLRAVIDRIGNYNRVRGSGILHYEYDLPDGSAVLLTPGWPFKPTDKICEGVFYLSTNDIKFYP
jgi:hypothetical protein